MKVYCRKHKHSMTGVPSKREGDEMKTAQEMVNYLYQFYTLQKISDMTGLSQSTIYNAKSGYELSRFSINKIRGTYKREYKKRNRLSPPNFGGVPPIEVTIKPKLTARQNELISERLVKETEERDLLNCACLEKIRLEKIRLALTDQFQSLNGNTDFRDDPLQ